MYYFRKCTLRCWSSALLKGAAAVALLFFVFATAGGGRAAPPAVKAATKARHKAAATRLPVLTGTVLDAASGSPVAGATVYVYTATPRTGTSPFCPSCYADCGKRQATDARGAFHIPVIARSLIFRLVVVREGYEPTFVPRVDPLDAKICRVALKNVRNAAADPDHLIMGRVLDDSGQPVVGATVEPFGKKTPGGESFGGNLGVELLAITNEQGLFRFHSPDPDTVLLAKVQARGLAPQIVSGLSTGSAQPHDIRLSLGTTVAGTLRNANGRKIPGTAVVQVVHADRAGGNFVGWFEIGSDKDGKFSLPNVPAGKEYIVCVRMDSLSGSALATARRAVTAGKDGTITGDVNLTLRPAATVTGRITLSDRKSVPGGTRILLSRYGTWDVLQATFSRDGRFTFRAVPQGDDFTLSVYVPGYHFADSTPMHPQSPGSYWLKTALGRPTANVRISLVPNVRQ